MGFNRTDICVTVIVILPNFSIFGQFSLIHVMHIVNFSIFSCAWIARKCIIIEIQSCLRLPCNDVVDDCLLLFFKWTRTAHIGFLLIVESRNFMHFCIFQRQKFVLKFQKYCYSLLKNTVSASIHAATLLSTVLTAL